MAAVGERSLARCGEITDRIIVSNLLPSGYAAPAAAIVRETAAAAGRPVPEIVLCVPCVARADRDEPRRIVKPPHARAAA